MGRTRDPQADLIRKNLQRFRNEAGLTQEDLSMMSGVPMDNLRRYESGKNGPSLTALGKIAEVLQRHVDDFIKAEPPPGRKIEPPTFFLRTRSGAPISENVYRELLRQVKLAEERNAQDVAREIAAKKKGGKRAS